MATGDTSSLSPLTTSECETCERLSSRITKVYDAGGRFEGGAWSVRGMRYSRLPDRNAYVVAGVRIAKQTVVDRQGGEPVENAATRGSLEFRMRPAGESWAIYELVAQ